MKDFAKSVRTTKVGNAKDKNGIELKVGDVVAVKTDDPELNHGKIKRISGDQVSVDVTGDDDIWTTPARLVVKMGNSKVGNMDAFLSNAETFAKEWIKEVDKAAKEENVNKLTGLLNSAEAKIKELEKYGEEKFAEYKKASELVPKFREIAFYAKSDIGLLKSK